MAEQGRKDKEFVAPQKAARDAVSDTETDENADQIPVERLVDESQGFLGVPSHVAAGAFSGVNRKSLTLDEAESAVSTWQKAVIVPKGEV